jgi:hypothetical protein
VKVSPASFCSPPPSRLPLIGKEPTQRVTQILSLQSSVFNPQSSILNHSCFGSFLLIDHAEGLRAFETADLEINPQVIVDLVLSSAYRLTPHRK